MRGIIEHFFYGVFAASASLILEACASFLALNSAMNFDLRSILSWRSTKVAFI